MEVDRKEEIIKKLRAELGEQKRQVSRLESEIKSFPSVNDAMPPGFLESKDLKWEKRVKEIKDQEKPREEEVKRRVDTGSSYPNEAVNSTLQKDKSESDLGQSKSMTLPPPAKDLKDLKATMLQFRTVLRISNVGVKEFLDSVVFKDKKTSIAFSEFKVRIEAILKNHTHDFACYCFQSQPVRTREQLDTILNNPNVHFELEDYLDERLETELKNCKMTLKDAFEIEDTRGSGTVTLKQYEEILESLDLELDRGNVRFRFCVWFCIKY